MKRWEISYEQTFKITFVTEINASSEKIALKKAKQMASKGELAPNEFETSTILDKGSDFNALEIT